MKRFIGYLVVYATVSVVLAAIILGIYWAVISLGFEMFIATVAFFSLVTMITLVITKVIFP